MLLRHLFWCRKNVGFCSCHEQLCSLSTPWPWVRAGTFKHDLPFLEFSALVFSLPLATLLDGLSWRRFLLLFTCLALCLNLETPQLVSHSIILSATLWYCFCLSDCSLQLKIQGLALESLVWHTQEGWGPLFSSHLELEFEGNLLIFLSWPFVWLFQFSLLESVNIMQGHEIWTLRSRPTKHSQYL